MQEIFKQQKALLEKNFRVTPPDAVFSLCAGGALKRR